MSNAGNNILAIFGEALECASASEQAAHLDRACGGDSGVRSRVEALLRAHNQAGDFLQGSASRGANGEHAREGPGATIGPYQVIDVLGEGGFGIVYLAEQRSMRRQVALKVLKPGMDTRQVIARFEAERQALALMEHPNIARVFDGGETETGRPYFVMELVKGLPITEHCDQHHLMPGERLALFVSVCQAVQHAHQKGIIHRDLKPSNILVAQHDGAAVVKVIDFGIAKAIGQQLTDQTAMTGMAQVLGTPLYMSPEQAGMANQDIDTRTDIYSLGVVLYELLTGTTPFDRERLREASWDELRRMIREEEPPKPSTRLSTLGPAAETISEQRQVNPRRLGQLLRGDLDWIVMKCLEKDRSRRYESAGGLARDLERFLADEPVEACPPSVIYRLRKFVRRHRRELLTAAAFLGLLLAGGVMAGWQAVREARAERDRVVQQARLDGNVREALDLTRTLREQARAGRDRHKWAAAREQAQRALALAESGAIDAELMAQVQQVQEELEQEEKDRRFVADIEAARIGRGERSAGKNRFAFEQAIPQFREAFHTYGLPVGEGDPHAAAARLARRPADVRLAAAAAVDIWLAQAANPEYKAGEPHREWLRAFVAAQPDDGAMHAIRAAGLEQDPVKRRAALEQLAAGAIVRDLPASALTRLAVDLRVSGSADGAVRLLRRTWQQYPADFWVNHSLGAMLADMEPPAYAEAVRHLTAAAALRPESAGVLYNLGNALAGNGQVEEAIACYRKALEFDPQYAQAHNNLGLAYRRRGQVDEAIACYRRALSFDRDLIPALCNLGVALKSQGQLEEARGCFGRVVEIDAQDVEALFELGNVEVGLARLDEAITHYRKALAVKPTYAEVHCNLGQILRQVGEYQDALAALRIGHELGSKRKDWRYNNSEKWLKQCERSIQLDQLRARVLEGKYRPTDAAEWLELAEVCRQKMHYAAAARFSSEALKAEPQLADKQDLALRYLAACYAALAAAGQGKDAAALEEAERARLQRQARQWLEAELKLLSQLQVSNREVVHRQLQKWQRSQELATVREADALARLPDEERAAWQQLWADVAALHVKSSGSH